MIHGHGDDIFRYSDIRANFSSNVYNHFDHRALYAHLAKHMECLAHYPAPAPEQMERRLAETLGIDASEVMVTAGGTEAIYLTAQAHRRSRSVIVQPTFSEYADACRVHEHRVAYVYPHQMSAGEDGRDAWVPAGCEMVWMCNPNNPTGQVWPRADLLRLVREHPATLFVLDASYAPFTEQPLISPCEGVEVPNLLMLHSITKEYGLPGLRLGYVTAQAALLETLRRMRMPWTVNPLALEAGLWLVDHRVGYRLPLRELMEERERVSRELCRLGIVEVWPSDSHMLLCRLRMGRADNLKEFLATHHGLLIRDASNFEGLDAGYFRIAVQTAEEDDQMIKAITEWIES